MFLRKQSNTYQLMRSVKKATEELQRAKKCVEKTATKLLQTRELLDESRKQYDKPNVCERRKLQSKEKEALSEHNKAVYAATKATKKLETVTVTLNDYAKHVASVPEKYRHSATVKFSKDHKWLHIRFGEKHENTRSYGAYDLHIRSEKVECRHKYEPQSERICNCAKRCNICKCYPSLR